MKVDIFDFDLPRELIASQPISPRDASRLLDFSGEAIIDRHFSDLPDILRAGDILVCNDTKVIPARLYAQKGEAHIEVTLYHPEADGLSWWAFIKNAKRLHNDDIIKFYNDNINAADSDFSATIIKKDDEDGVLLKFNGKANELPLKLQQFGFMPLPPYIKRDRPSQNSIWHKFNDKENYQTVYAANPGAVAAPTAGLHFTPEVMEKIKAKGVKQVFVTLHVGAGTFLPVKVDDTNNHKMHAEYGIISKEVADAINQAKQQGGRVIAVGTTSLRLLESAADDKGVLHPFCADTDIFITPGYKFKAVDLLITNFHLPKSTLFMLVCALRGLEPMRQAYAHAIEQKYRFYSYGDSSILKCVNKI